MDIGKVIRWVTPAMTAHLMKTYVTIYERQRLKNIKENQDLLHSLGKIRVCIAIHLLLLLLLLFSLILLLVLLYY